MRCFSHANSEAVGICGSCLKGVCRDCAVDLGYGLACSGEHEQKVRIDQSIRKSNLLAYADEPKNILFGPIFIALMGATFAGYGFINKQSFTNFEFVMGAGFIIYALAKYLRGKKYIANK